MKTIVTTFIFVVLNFADFSLCIASDNTPQTNITALPAQDTILREKAQNRWRAIISGDFEKSYGYETPDYRKKFSLESYKSRFGKSVSWLDSEVVTLNIVDNGSLARVLVAVLYSAPSPVSNGVVTNKKFLWEEWVIVESEWYHKH